METYMKTCRPVAPGSERGLDDPCAELSYGVERWGVWRAAAGGGEVLRRGWPRATMLPKGRRDHAAVSVPPNSLRNRGLAVGKFTMRTVAPGARARVR
jgi:hypothetical protein